jgi:hypothetical protein
VRAAITLLIGSTVIVALGAAAVTVYAIRLRHQEISLSTFIIAQQLKEWNDLLYVFEWNISCSSSLAGQIAALLDSRCVVFWVSIGSTAIAPPAAGVRFPSDPRCPGAWPANPQLLYLGDQRSALQAKFGRCSVRTSDHPRGRFEGVQNDGAFGVSKSTLRRINGDRRK